ncbi:MAG: PAS domain S-box protein, partial [Deltaproteobacteria bacterium]|nr:PAS domain S-box protein [Deltaproteobacteria bacterium]
MTQPKTLTGRSGPRCILIIEDDFSVRSSIKQFLDDSGFLVLDADNGYTGLELYQQHHPDLILLDLRMPKFSGLDFLTQIRAADPDIPVIVVSGTGEINDVVEALRHGASDFLLKPIVDLLMLQHSVEKALERSRLQQENRNYREHLEEIIEQRTVTLERTCSLLRQSEEKYRSIFENLQDIYFETSLDGVLLEISPSVEKGTRYKRDDLLGKNVWAHYVIPEQREQLLQTLQAEGRIEGHEVLLADSDGQQIYFSINALLHRDNRGQPSHISGIMRNISEWKSTEEALRRSNQTLEALFNAAPLAILAIDMDMRITLWNPAAEEIFGWQRSQVIGRTYPLALPGREEEAYANLARALAGNHLQGLEISRRHKDGHSVDISAATAPLYDSNGTICGAIIIIEDISEKCRLRSEADRYSRLASLGELAAGVAHEINNPNGLILLNLPTLNDFVMDAIALQQKLAVDQPGRKLGGLKPERAAEAFPQLMTEIGDSALR